MNIDKQIKIGSDLYVVVTEPYEISTDAERIFVPEDYYVEFLLMNQDLEDKLYKYNYNSISVSNSPIRKYLTDLEYQYFTIVALGNGTIPITMPANLKTTMFEHLSYSVNGGEWVKITNTNSAVTHTISSITKGDRIYFKGVGKQVHNTTGGTLSQLDSNCLRIKPSFQFNLEGNIMSLLYGDNFRDKYVIDDEKAFERLFAKNNNIIHTKDLILPAKTLSKLCYYQMFSTCGNLLDSPKDLPAKICPYGCYAAMFDTCSKLKTAPKFHGTWYGEQSVYRFIFHCPVETEISDINCTYAGQKAFFQAFEYSNIKRAPSIKCDVMEGESVFREMFLQTNIEEAGDIEIGNVTLYSFVWAYAYCNKLKKAPSLTVKRLDNKENFANMFNSCTSLEYPMKISDGLKFPINGISHCYEGCTSLKETMPLMDIEIVGEEAFEGCYNGCMSLETVRQIKTKNVSDEAFKDYLQNTGVITRIEEISIGTIDDATSSFENFMNGSQSVVTPTFKIEEIGSGATSTFKSAFSGCTNITDGAKFNINWDLKEDDFTNAYADCPKLKKVELPTENSPSSGTCTTILANNEQNGKLYLYEGVTLPEDAAIPESWTIKTR